MITLVQKQVLSVAQAGFVLVMTTLAVAWTSSVMRLLLPAFGLAIYLSTRTDGKLLSAETVFLIALALAFLVGLYVLFGGAFQQLRIQPNDTGDAEPGKFKRKQSLVLLLFTVAGLVPTLDKLVNAKVVTVQGAVALIIFIVVVYHAIKPAMRMIMPIFSMALFVSLNAGSYREAGSLAVSVFTLVLAMFGVYLVFIALRSR